MELLELFAKPALVLVLVFLVYWAMEWIKEVVPVHENLKQPLALLVGTVISGFVLFNYDFHPVDFGDSRFLVVEFLLQGAFLAAMAGVFYDSIMKKFRE